MSDDYDYDNLIDSELNAAADIERELASRAAAAAAANAKSKPIAAAAASKSAADRKTKSVASAAAGGFARKSDVPDPTASAGSGGGGGGGSGSGSAASAKPDRLTAALAPYLTPVSDGSAADDEYSLSRSTAARRNAAAVKEAEATANEKNASEPEPDEPVPPCVECQSLSYDQQFWKAFGVSVCYKCKKLHTARYAVVTKTEAKTHYLLTDTELAGLKYISKPHTKHNQFGTIKLYRLESVLAASDKKFGSAAKREEAKSKRELKSLERKISLERNKRKRDGTSSGAGGDGDGGDEDDSSGGGGSRKRSERKLTPAVMTATAPGHVHSFGPQSAASDGAAGFVQRKCTECGFIDRFEEI